MSYKTTIELFKEDMKFSAGHFTIFSATERERLHGHNFKVKGLFSLEVSSNGLTADYNIFKDKLRALCNSLDEYFLIPSQSPHLQISEKDQKVYLKHNTDELIFYKKDVKLLPISNTTVEELSYYLTNCLIEDENMLETYKIDKIEIKVSSGEGQLASYTWFK
jgi:6-pyruvoyltetrahydropterin/6-carboxytetrahydropterin synthase